MTARLIDSLATTGEMAAAFDDKAVVGAMLRFETALALAQARCGVIPDRAAQAIAEAAGTPDAYDAEAMARAARSSGAPVISFVSMLTARVASTDPESARFVHHGATSQDVVDTAMVLTLVRAAAILRGGHARLTAALRSLSDRHAHTTMLGRTLLQPGPPITFGLKVAGWCDAVSRSGDRMFDAFDAALVLQFGGAVGTLAALGSRRQAVAEALADELDLDLPAAPWHAHRDRLGALVAACGLYTATLGKIARDVSLLMQDEVGEVSERGGGSSTMPHKRNPSGCAIVLAAATRVPALVAAFLAGMVQEHERSVGGWQAEWPTIAAAVQATESALAAAVEVIDHLEVFPDRMRENIQRTNGTVFAERVMLGLSASLGREAAMRLVTEVLERSRATGQSFGDLARATVDIARAMSADDLAVFDQPDTYLGAAEQMRVSLLRSARAGN
jgi:3-carboxy-cis,cis-muconate cycloisomerase